ncbi:PTS mannose transporter subunit EIIAB [Erysipelotrichaceae bacterium MTC7]|nr:PTS mannose transporter subunit EIIAB [Erysipelotrichaceae bacterium MTC7]
MVGIILASHGDLAQGALNSGEMIFGKQENIKAVSLTPSEGPEDIRKKMEAAVQTFENQEEVLILVDLWGGTPFNQANALIQDHATWCIVTGLNLPMLIETFASRMSMDKAVEIAKHISKTAKEGVQIAPKSLEEKEATAHAKKATLAEGTVVGDGKIKYVLARIDSRLLHGQVATAWTKEVQPTRIIVVSDAVAKDELRKTLIEQAAPPGVKANVVPVDKMIQVAKNPRFGNTKAMLLFENPQDVLRAVEGGVDLHVVNVGSMAHSLGKVAVNKVISLSEDDIQTFDALKKDGIQFDVRKVPADSKENMDEIINKAKKSFTEV